MSISLSNLLDEELISACKSGQLPDYEAVAEALVQRLELLRDKVGSVAYALIKELDEAGSEAEAAKARLSSLSEEYDSKSETGHSLYLTLEHVDSANCLVLDVRDSLADLMAYVS